MSRQTSTIWWAGYATGISLAVLYAMYRGALRGNPWRDVPILLAIIWYANRIGNRAEKEIRANTVELIEPSPGYLRFTRNRK